MKNFTTKIDLQKKVDNIKIDLMADIDYMSEEDSANEINSLTSRFISKNIKEFASLTKHSVSLCLKEYLDECCNAEIKNVDVTYIKLIEKENER